jgi:hypothetical protein
MTITLAGFVWQFYGGQYADPHTRALLMLGNAARVDAYGTQHLKTRAIWIPKVLVIPTLLLERDAHVIVTAEYIERDGRLPSVNALAVEAFDERATDEWKRWY